MVVHDGGRQFNKNMKLAFEEPVIEKILLASYAEDMPVCEFIDIFSQTFSSESAS